jgi:putative transcriptional regulator
MTLNHHPSDETLLAYAAETLAPGARVVAAVHVGCCVRCRTRVSQFEALGGVVVDQLEPSSLSDGALERVMARIDEPAVPPREALHAIAPTKAPIGIELPPALDDCGIGPWRWVAPGVRWSKVSVPGDTQTNVMLLKVAAGKRLPEHTHTGREFTLVLSGSFSDDRGRYAPGDFDEADSEIEHQPVVDKDGECICLAAIEGRMLLRGLLGRLVQPFVGP